MGTLGYAAMPRVTCGNIQNQLVVEWIEASATETVDSGSILGQVKPKIIKIGIQSFLAWHSAIKRDSVNCKACEAIGSLTRRPSLCPFKAT